MKIFNKLTSVLLAVMLVLTAVPSFAFAEGEAYQNDARLLAAMGIIDENFSENENVNQIDVIYAAARLTGYNAEFTYNANLPYGGIVPGYEHLNVINFAYITKLIDEGDALSPDTVSTVAFAAKVFVNAAGYGDKARAVKNYVSLSQYREITKGVSGKNLNFGAFVTMLTNLLDVDYYSADGTDGGYIDYRTEKGKSVAAHYLDIYTVDGVMEKTHYASLTGSYCEDGFVVIDGTKYKIDDISLVNLACRRIKGAYKDENGTKKLIYAYADDEKIIEADACDVGGYKNNVFNYTDKNGKEKNIRTKTGTVIIYNGENVTGSAYSSNLFSFNEGKVSLIDYGEGYSVIKIEAYKNIAVGAVNVSGDSVTVADKYDADKKVRLDTSGYLCIENADGKCSVSDIKTGCVLTYAQSANGKFAKAYVSDRKIVGTVTEKETANGRTFVTVDGERYEVTQVFGDDNKLNLNELYICYINAFGKIGIMRTTKNSGGLLGYLTEKFTGESLKDRDILTLKILTNDSELDDTVSFKTAKKVTVDGESGLKGEKAEEALEKWSVSQGKTEFAPTAICYTLNEIGEIVTIDTPYRGAKESSETLTRRRSSADGTMLVKNMNTFNAGYTFDLKYYTAKDAMHIGYEKANPDEFYHTSYPNEKALALDLYSLGTDTLQCVIAVAESSASEDKYEDNFALITKVRRTLNNDEDEIYKVSAVYGGKEVTFNTRDLAAHPISGIKEGNIVPISLDSKNRLLSAGTAVFNYDNFKKGVPFIGSQNYSVNRIANARYVTGTVYSVETDEKSGISYVYYYIDNPGNLSVLMLRSNINYTVEKLNDGTIKYGVLDIGTAQDTVKGYKNFGHDADAVVIRYSYWVPSYSFIVKR